MLVRAHIPVLIEPLLRLTRPADGRLDRVIDGTLGAGGHARAMLQAGAGEVLAFDLDDAAIEVARRNLAPYLDRVTIVHSNYVDMRAFASKRGWREVDVIILDLGLSSMQLDDPARGFAFRHEGPLDMRFDALTESGGADKLVNSLPEQDLAGLFFRYGEEREARKIAAAIIAERPIRSTVELADLVRTVVPRRRMAKIHPATKVFQALRIAVNRELESLEKALPTAVDLLRPGGRLAVIAFHSLEDRIVKRRFRELARDIVAPPGMASIEERRALLSLVNRKPIAPDDKELSSNPRSRSAKLRVVEKLKFD